MTDPAQTPRERALAAARQYVDLQLATMRRYESAPELSQAEYETLVEDIAAVTDRLRRRHA